MAKSSQSFNKREKEKQKAKERQEKREKMEERKANAKKGQSLEDMMAYIDENGNLSTTPPDPSKMKTFNAEDIEIGVPQHQYEPEEAIRIGTVNFFNTAKGYGFIKDTEKNESFFVHMNDLQTPIKENDIVTFKAEPSQRGMKAVEVKVFVAEQKQG